MKTSLQLHLGQQLTMTPQMQQAIRLLQLSSLELQTEIQQTLESNPLLEQIESEEDQEYLPSHALQKECNSDNNELNSSLKEEIIPEDLLLDSSWSDTYDSVLLLTSSEQEILSDLAHQKNNEETLQEYLLGQAYLSFTDKKDFTIAASIIDAINDEGYLCDSLTEIMQDLQKNIVIDPNDVKVVLHRIQNFDPPGIGASNLSECLLLQLKRYPPDTLWLEDAKKLISHHLEALSKRDYAQIMRGMKLSEQDLLATIRLIQTLNPRPGNKIQANRVEYIVPDIYVTKRGNGRWEVELNPDIVPTLRVNNYYANLIKRADSSFTNSYLKNQLQEARWFLKSLHNRNETLLKTACCIIDRQQAFLEYGDKAMQPLVLHDIAKAISMHESTISRVTTNKYIYTPQGIYELKHFFSNHVASQNGKECSATAIRAIIKKLIAVEDPRNPLSDDKIAQNLAKQGIKVARRTIAKYREFLNISTSHERKRLI
ncbi:RNA polymerase factor sigma-54 [Candidatus Nitrosoglobus terrae]|nr:RNA polymerase factor sigma-54 [Candidatus Nitrosoglobus terrae]